MGSNQQKEHGNFFYSSVKQSSAVFQGHVTLLLNKFFLVCSSGRDGADLEQHCEPDGVRVQIRPSRITPPMISPYRQQGTVKEKYSTHCSPKQNHKHLNGESRETPTVQLQSTIFIHIYPSIPNHNVPAD
jgi:hypothetical protein